MVKLYITFVILTYKYRVKDKHSAALNRMAKGVNYVWNYCNDVQKHALKWDTKWPTGFDLSNKTAGSTLLLGLHAGTVNAVCEQYAQSRKQHKKPFLRYRGEKSLGWIPLKGRGLRFNGDKFRFFRKDFSVWMSRNIPEGASIRGGSGFSQDSRGRWYLNVVVQTDAVSQKSGPAIGVDLGLKDLAVLSDGVKIKAPRIFRNSEKRLIAAQSARKRRQVKKIHAKIFNQRRDFLHKVSTKMVRDYGHIVVGNVSSSKLAKTKMAKSVLDAGWSTLRNQLAYKSDHAGVTFQVVNEAYSSQACSECGSLGGPKGRQGLCIREWQCVHCGASHDRDVNSARYILRLGQETLIAGAA